MNAVIYMATCPNCGMTHGTTEFHPAVVERAERLRAALEPIVREYDLWSEDANDGEFRLWDLDRLVMAIVNARGEIAEGTQA